MTRQSFSVAARDLARIGRRFAVRGWVQGTSGNFSAVISRRPLRLAMTPSAADKGALRASQIVTVDGAGRRVSGGKALPSAETLLHLAIVRRRGAGAVLHTHSVWSTILSEARAGDGELRIEGFEMLKGLSGVTTHEHVERIPIVANDQNMPRLAARVDEALDRHGDAHAILLRRHGLYTWGNTLGDAVRHIEILEFLFEAVGRAASYHGNG